MKLFAARILLGLLITSSSSLFAEIITTLNKNDPAPLWSTYAPLDFLLAGRKAFYKGVGGEPFPETFSLSISPFHQKASRGRNFEKQRVPLSDLEGRWNMVGLLYGGIPQEVQNQIGTQVPNAQQLGNAKVAVFSDLANVEPNTVISENSHAKYLLDDQCKRVGYFSVPLRYRKTGLRFEMQLSPFFDFGITVRSGVAEIKQTYTMFHDLIPTASDGCCEKFDCPPLDIPVIERCCPINIDAERIPAEFRTSIPKVRELIPSGTLACNEIPNPDCQPRYQAVEDQLMDPCVSQRIYTELCLDPCNFRDTSVEDVYISAWFRHAFQINVSGNGVVGPNGSGKLTNCTTCTGSRSQAIYTDNQDTRDPRSYHTDTGCGNLCADTTYCYDYSAFLFIPFISFNVSLPTAKKQDRTKLFSLPFGNDGHTGLGMDAGFNFDFYETVEFGIEAGFMRWNCKEIRSEIDDMPAPLTDPRRWYKGMRIPTQAKQSGVFPFATTVQRRPGTNYHFSAVLSAFRFLCNLSGFAQYVFVSHAEDDLFITDANNPEVNGARIFKPKQAECLSKFESQLFNTGLNYEIGENFSLGFLVQWPVAQRNAYRSTTYMGSLRMIF